MAISSSLQKGEVCSSSLIENMQCSRAVTQNRKDACRRLAESRLESRGPPGKQPTTPTMPINLSGTAPGRKGAEAFLPVESRLKLLGHHQRDSQRIVEIFNHRDAQ